MYISKLSLLLVPLALLLCAGGIFAYLKLEQKPAAQKTGIQGVQTDSTSASTLQQSLTQASPSGQTKLNPDGTLPLGGDGAAQNSLPTPDNFSQYNQYTGAESALYAVIKEGTGEPSKLGDTVAMLYKGWLTDGTLFDQSRPNEQGQMQAFGFRLGAGEVIKGWDEGIAGMKVGGKRRLIIPPSSGYGPSGQGPIPPNSVLVFDVELVQITPQP